MEPLIYYRLFNVQNNILKISVITRKYFFHKVLSKFVLLQIFLTRRKLYESNHKSNLEERQLRKTMFVSCFMIFTLS